MSKYIKSTWGMASIGTDRISIEKFIKDSITSGYIGFEIAIQFMSDESLLIFTEICNELNLHMVAQIHTMGYPD